MPSHHDETQGQANVNLTDNLKNLCVSASLSITLSLLNHQILELPTKHRSDTFHHSPLQTPYCFLC